MTRIFSSALRPIRLNAGRAFQGATEIASIPLGRRTYTPRSTTSSPPSSSTAPKPNTGYSQTTYKRSATTSSSSSSNNNNNNNNNSSPSAPRPATNSNSSPSSAPASRPATSAYAESQLNPVTQPPYVPPPGAGSIPETNPYAYQAFASSNNNNNGIDWSSSFHGLSTTPFSPEVAAVLMKPIPFEDVEIKPDGIIYLPEIKYRRILNQAFGPGGWGMAPRGELMVGEKVVTREYALLVHGRFIAQARGECQFFGNDDGVATAGEGCKSNALMRCCKDLGVASELWDPRYIREYKKKYTQEIWCEHVATKKKRQIWVRRGDDPQYPYKRS